MRESRTQLAEAIGRATVAAETDTYGKPARASAPALLDLDQDLGFVVDSECGYKIFAKKPRQIRKPDVSFIAKGRLPDDILPEGDMTIPPDLAVEVISPNDIAQDIERRISDLHSAGVRLLWIVYPVTRSVWILRKDGSGARLTEDQDLSGEDVVPGFTLRIAQFTYEVRFVAAFSPCFRDICTH